MARHEYREKAMVCSDAIEDIFNSIEWDINDILRDLENIQGIDIIDAVRGKLETLARKVY